MQSDLMLPNLMAAMQMPINHGINFLGRIVVVHAAESFDK